MLTWEAKAFLKVCSLTVLHNQFKLFMRENFHFFCTYLFGLHGSFLLFLKDLLLLILQKERYKSQINQNFATNCHTEVCLTFSRLAAKFSDMIGKFRGRSLKVQPRWSFDLNGFKNGTRKYFENILKSFQIFQILI